MRIPLTERDGWLRHYLRQSLTSSELDYAMRFNDRAPTSVINVMARSGVAIQREKSCRNAYRFTWVYPVKPLIAVVRAQGVVVTQNNPRQWVPEEVAAAEVQYGRERIAEMQGELNRRAQELEDLRRQKAIELARARGDALQQVRDEYAMRDMAPEDVVTLMGLMMTAHELRPLAGVYWLVDSTGEIVYVGQSKNCLSRMSGHRDKPFTSARMIAVENDVRRSTIERMLIVSLRPGQNIQMVSGRRAKAA